MFDSYLRRAKTILKSKFPRALKLYQKTKIRYAHLNLIERLKYRYRFARNKPYFGAFCAASQSGSRRYEHMRRLIKEECRLSNDRPFRILEIGSWAGGSAVLFAGALKEFNRGLGIVVCVDPWSIYLDRIMDGNKNQRILHKIMTKAVLDNKIHNLFLHNVKASGHEDIVVPIKGPSERVLPLLGRGYFDVVYVDGAHTYREVLLDITLSSHLVKDGGILCGDDLELQSFQCDLEHAEKMKCNVEFVVDPKSNTGFHPGVTMAVRDFFGEVSVWDGFWAMRKRGNNFEEFSDYVMT